jgi:Domain of unknown function (DUF4091)
VKLCKPTSGRRYALGFSIAALAVVCLTLSVASAAQAAVWTAGSTARIVPGTPAGTTQAASVSAAGGEYEGLIVGLRGSAARTVSATWSADSDPLLTANSILDQVYFVHIKHPSTFSGAKAGLYPDPLVPRAWGQSLGVPAGSSSLYVLFHVPYGTTAGTYSGTLHVSNGAEQVDVPVTLTVYSFGWQKLSVRTAFSVNFNKLGGNLVADYKMLADHGITPQMPKVVPRTTSSGAIYATPYGNALDPYLSANGLDLTITVLPWLHWWPAYSWKMHSGNTALLNYLANVCRVFSAHGWTDKLIAYPVDEPNTTSAERAADNLARTLHKASARAGFRANFLLTDDPRPTRVASHAANKFLFNDVDIWCVRYYYFFGRVPVLRKLQARGAQVWWYPYYNSSVAKLPNFVIDKSLADERVWGWLMYQWKVDGMLYWGITRWGNALTGKGNRDPYKDPLSFKYRDGRVANGEASLIYPGYYPAYGLNDKSAPPVSSLRLEALRDGFQDLEYLRIAAATPGITPAAISAVVKTVTWYPYPIKYGHIFNFPKYKTTLSPFDTARARIANMIEAAQATAPESGS